MQNDSYNRGGFIAFVFSMVFSILFFGYIVWIHPGVDLKEVKPTVETNLAGGAPAEKKVDVTKIEKPWEENADMVTYGATVYANACAVCHGQKGLGDGPAGLSLNPKPRNFVEGKDWKNGADSIGIYKTLQAGIPGSSMASFAHLPSTDRWALVQYVRSLAKEKVADDPAKVAAFAKDAK